jgi:serine phosphatase RsbU (regulator of sigma subunit)/CHASE3 domain sensor protein
MPLSKRLAIMLTLMFSVFMTMGVFGAVLSRLRVDAAAKEQRFGVSVEQSLRLATSFSDMETGIRGYDLTGRSEFLGPYRSGKAAVAQIEVALLRNADHYDQETRRALTTVIASGDSWRSFAERALDANHTPLAKPTDAIAFTAAKGRFDTLRKSLADLTELLSQGELGARKVRSHRANQIFVLVGSMPFVGLGLLLVATALVRRWVKTPIQNMSAAVHLVADGDLTATVPSSGATDIAALGSDINRMRQTIIDRLYDAEHAQQQEIRARKAVEQDTILTLQLQSELASELGQFPDGWTAAAELLPAEGWVAGDCYDVTLVSPHVMGIIVLDIAGHGAHQAILALKCKEILRAALRAKAEPGEALKVLAEQVNDLHPSFLTAFVALLDTRTGLCRYANAGHPPALLATHNNVVTELEPTGPLLGVFASRWLTQQAHIEPGGKLAVYTDGLSEARNHTEEFYGMERLANIVITLPCAQAEHVIEACFADLQNFAPARLHDDVTMVLICRACAEV